MPENSLKCKLPTNFRSKNKYKKLPNLPVFMSQQFSDLRFKLKKNNQIGQVNKKEKNEIVIDEGDIYEESYDYKTVYIDGFCDDCLRVYSCGLLNYGHFSKVNHSHENR